MAFFVYILGRLSFINMYVLVCFQVIIGVVLYLTMAILFKNESYYYVYNYLKTRYFNHEKNLGMMANFIFTLKQATGNYIALCEGDDYATNIAMMEYCLSTMSWAVKDAWVQGAQITSVIGAVVFLLVYRLIAKAFHK